MKINGILNSDISRVLANLGHTDQITIGDCGLPIPNDVEKIDIALKLGQPTFIEVLEEVLKDMKIEKIILANEIQSQNKEQWERILNLVGDQVEIEYVAHEDFKKLTHQSKAVIRTGDIISYSNVILQSNVIF